VLKRDYDGQVCSLARTLEVVGERWTLLIVRDAFLGLRRFDEFQRSLGVARNVLSDRLQRLVVEGILTKVPTAERADRFEYRLTPKGRDLGTALAALREWGDRYVSDEPPLLLRRRSDGHPVVTAFVLEGADVDHPDVVVPASDLENVPGPGRRPSTVSR
jgi:DNA-binding HxlR family transcriptional regulator